MKYFSLIVTAIIAILLSACKEETIVEEYNPNIKIYGLWEVVQADDEDFKFVDFDNNNSASTFFETTQGFRTQSSTIFSPTEDQVTLFITGLSGIFIYEIKGDSLILYSGNNGPFLKAVKWTSSEPDNWIKSVSPTDRIEGLFTDNSNGIGYDGSNLLFTNYSEGKIIKVSLATRTIIDEITTTESSLNTVEFDGTNYWVSSNGFSKLIQLNPTGTEIFSSVDLGPWIYGIGYVSTTSIVCYAGNTNTLYDYNPSTDAITSSKEIKGISLRDIAVSNGKAFIISGSNIYRLNASTFEVEASYQINGVSFIRGIASVGNNIFWINTNNGKEILKVDLN